MEPTSIKLAKLDKIDENLIVNHKTGVRSTIKDEHGMYVYPMKIQRKKKRNPNAMDIGKLGPENSGGSDKGQENSGGSGKSDEWTPF